MKSLQEYIKESLLQHIALELKNEDIIYEKYGQYNGCYELSSYICYKIINSNDNIIEIYYDDVKNIDNIVFNKLIIEVYRNYHVNKANYKVLEESTFDKETLKFTEVIIEVFIKDCKDLHSIISHELTHLYNDFIIQKIGCKTFFDLFNTNDYKISKEYIKTNKASGVRKLNHAIYLLNEFEKNAFMSQLIDEIETIKNEFQDKNIKTANQIYTIVKSLDIYKAYETVGVFINSFYNDELADWIKDEIIFEWEKMFNEKITIHQIFKKLKTKFIKAKNKIESIIPKKIAENNYVILDNVDTVFVE